MTQPSFLNRHALTIGIVLMFALTWPFYSALGLFVGYGLALASLIVTGLTEGARGVRALLERFLIWRVGVQWYLVIFLGPAALDLTAMGLDYLLRGVTPDFSNVEAGGIFGTSANLWIFVIPFFLVDALTNGEEMGWRGFVLPRLQNHFSALVSSLIVGALWGLWHLPKFLAAGDIGSLVLTVLDNIATAVLFTWVYGNTKGSLLIMTLFHASVNTAYVFLPVAPSATDDAMLGMITIIIEFVAASVVVVVTAGLSRFPRPSLLACAQSQVSGLRRRMSSQINLTGQTTTADLGRWRHADCRCLCSFQLNGAQGMRQVRPGD